MNLSSQRQQIVWEEMAEMGEADENPIVPDWTTLLIPEPFNTTSDHSDSVILVVEVEGYQLHVSRGGLGMVSPVLREKFFNSGGEPSDGVFTFPEKKLQDVLAFLYWVYHIPNPAAPMKPYCGCGVVDHCGVDIPMESMVGLLHIAKEWEVDALKEHCRVVYRHYLRTITNQEEGRKALVPLEALQMDETELKSVLNNIIRSSGISKEDILAVSAGYSTDFYVHFLKLLFERSMLTFEKAHYCLGCGERVRRYGCGCRYRRSTSFTEEEPTLAVRTASEMVSGVNPSGQDNPTLIPAPFDAPSDSADSVLLVVEERNVYTSKYVLIGVGDSPVLYEKFAIEGGEAREGRLALDNMKLADVLAFLFWRSGIRNPTAPMGSFCGCGEVDHCGVDIPMESLVGLLHIAEEWEVDALKEHCRVVYRRYLQTIRSEGEGRTALAPLEALDLEDTELKSILDKVFRSSGISKEDISAVSAGYSTNFYVRILLLLLERSMQKFAETEICFGCGKSIRDCRCRRSGSDSDDERAVTVRTTGRRRTGGVGGRGRTHSDYQKCSLSGGRIRSKSRSKE